MNSRSEHSGRSRVANRQMRELVKQQIPFTNSTGSVMAVTRQINDHDIYIVYSYGEHFPMFIYEHGVWYENCDTYSRTTSRHNSQCHPHVDTMPMGTARMKALAQYGIAGVSVGYGREGEQRWQARLADLLTDRKPTRQEWLAWAEENDDDR